MVIDRVLAQFYKDNASIEQGRAIDVSYKVIVVGVFGNQRREI